jgi:sulfate permease, SulP family
VPTRYSLPLFISLRGWSGASLPHDFAAGLTLAAIAIPEQIATARLGTFAPQLGLFAFIAGSFAFAAFGSNRYLSVGADSTITPIFAGSLLTLAASGPIEYVFLASSLALLVGAILVVSGFFRLGWIADLLSIPVTTGFLAGIAIHIALSQAPTLLGVAEGHGPVWQRVVELAGQLGDANPLALIIGLGVFTLTLVCERISPRIPGALIGLMAATLAAVAFKSYGHGVSQIGDIPTGLPHLSLPVMAFDSLLRLFPLAIMIAFVVMMQTAATTRAFSEQTEPANVNRDFVGVGAGSILAGLLGTFPVDASPPRTAVAAQSGARTQIAGLIAAAIIFFLIVFGASILHDVPNAALAGILLYIAQRILGLRTFAEIFMRTKVEFALALATLTTIVVFPIQIGVAIGIFLSLLHGIYTITQTRPIPFERIQGTTIWWPKSETAKSDKEPGVLVMGFQAPLSFLNAQRFRSSVLDEIEREERAISLFILEASSIVEIDYTASTIIADVITKCRAGGITFAIARLESIRAQNSFKRFGLFDLLGEHHIFHSVAEAVTTLQPSAGGRH